MIKDRRKYQRDYAETHREEARERKELERYRKSRCRSYWYAKLVLKREMPCLISDCSPEMVERERKRYEQTLAETV